MGKAGSGDEDEKPLRAPRKSIFAAGAVLALGVVGANLSSPAPMPTISRITRSPQREKQFKDKVAELYDKYLAQFEGKVVHDNLMGGARLDGRYAFIKEHNVHSLLGVTMTEAVPEADRRRMAKAYRNALKGFCEGLGFEVEAHWTPYYDPQDKVFSIQLKFPRAQDGELVWRLLTGGRNINLEEAPGPQR